MNVRELIHNLLENLLDKPARVRIIKRDKHGCAVSECYTSISYVMMDGSICVEYNEIKDWKEA